MKFQQKTFKNVVWSCTSHSGLFLRNYGSYYTGDRTNILGENKTDVMLGGRWGRDRQIPGHSCHNFNGVYYIRSQSCTSDSSSHSKAWKQIAKLKKSKCLLLLWQNIFCSSSFIILLPPQHKISWGQVDDIPPTLTLPQPLPNRRADNHAIRKHTSLDHPISNVSTLTSLLLRTLIRM